MLYISLTATGIVVVSTRSLRMQLELFDLISLRLFRKWSGVQVSMMDDHCPATGLEIRPENRDKAGTYDEGKLKVVLSISYGMNYLISSEAQANRNAWLDRLMR